MASRTIVAMFDSYTDAREAVTRLEAAGVPHDQISIVSNDESHKQYQDNDTEAGTGAGTGATLGTMLGGGAGLLAGLGLLAIPGLGPVVAAGWLAATAVGAGIGAAAGGLVGALTGAGISEEDAHVYAEGVRRGGTLVTVRADDSMAASVEDILDDEGTVDIDERNASWRSEGWSGTHDTNAGMGTQERPTPGMGAGAATTGGMTGAAASRGGMGQGSTAPSTSGMAASGTPSSGTSRGVGGTGSSDEEVVPVVEERLQVGKRDVSEGRVRVRSYVTETPVNETVTLRNEHVDVARRPVDRAVTQGDNVFQDRSIEAEARHEEAVVSKDARVVEEVVVKKTSDTDTKTISDTVRRTEVEVEDDRKGNADTQRR